MSNLHKAVKQNFLHKNDKSHVLDRKYDLFEEFEKSLQENQGLYLASSFLAISLLALAMLL